MLFLMPFTPWGFKAKILIFISIALKFQCFKKISKTNYHLGTEIALNKSETRQQSNLSTKKGFVEILELSYSNHSDRSHGNKQSQENKLEVTINVR